MPNVLLDLETAPFTGIKKRNLPLYRELESRVSEMWDTIAVKVARGRVLLSECAAVYWQDAFDFIERLPPNSIHAVVTDPPYPQEKHSKFFRFVGKFSQRRIHQRRKKSKHSGCKSEQRKDVEFETFLQSSGKLFPK